MIHSKNSFFISSGTAMSAPAAAVINSPYAPPVAPVAAAVSPVAAPILAAAPLGHLGANVAYGSTINHGAAIVAPLGLGLGHGLGLGLGLGKAIW